MYVDGAFPCGHQRLQRWAFTALPVALQAACRRRWGRGRVLDGEFAAIDDHGSRISRDEQSAGPATPPFA